MKPRPTRLKPVPPPPPVAPPPPVEPPPEIRMPPPHPLDLNRNEGRWMHHAEGPDNGWFNFTDHGNPPFDTPVQVVVSEPSNDGGIPRMINVVAVGMRTRKIVDGLGREAWQVFCQFEQRSNRVIYWRFLSAPP